MGSEHVVFDLGVHCLPNKMEIFVAKEQWKNVYCVVLSSPCYSNLRFKVWLIGIRKERMFYALSFSNLCCTEHQGLERYKDPLKKSILQPGLDMGNVKSFCPLLEIHRVH